MLSSNIPYLECTAIVRTIPAHCHNVIVLLEAYNNLTLLLWSKACKYCAAHNNMRDQLWIMLLNNFPCCSIQSQMVAIGRHVQQCGFL